MSAICSLRACTDEQVRDAMKYAAKVSGVHFATFEEFDNFLNEVFRNFGDNADTDDSADTACQAWLTAYLDKCLQQENWLELCLWPFLSCEMFGYEVNADYAAEAIATSSSAVMNYTFMSHAYAN